jgi:quinol-cytochrome oxidoreductase complex cytochrome b subunit
MRPSFFLHLHPPTIPAKQARFRYTLAAGGMAVFLMFILLLTGILEMFFYVPTPSEAGNSLQSLTFLVPYGGLIRNLHYWSAQLLLIITLIHLMRVILTASYYPPRRVNYFLGMGLMVLILLMDFTGYILRWDEGIHWALITGTNLIKSIPYLGNSIYTIIVGGPQTGPATLIRFYGWHIFGLTSIAFVLTGWHIFRIRRDGGIAVPPPSLRKEKTRIPRAELLRREVLAMILASVILLILSSFAPAPLEPPIGSDSAVPEVARAPWFFLWIQQLLKLGNPFIWGIVVPSAVLLLIVLFPYLFPIPADSELGSWFPKSNRLAQVVALAIMLIFMTLTVFAIIPAA